VATLNIRNLPDEVHQRLRLRAARAGRSMEAEAREILAAAVQSEVPRLSPGELQDFVSRLYAGDLPSSAVDDLLAERRREAAAE